jgi:hypothetical protein
MWVMESAVDLEGKTRLAQAGIPLMAQKIMETPGKYNRNTYHSAIQK